MKTAPVKTDRDNGSFSIISLIECQKALSEAIWKIDLEQALALIPTCIGDFTDFWDIWDISLDYETSGNHSVLSGSDGGG